MKVNLKLDAWYDGEENTKEGVEVFVREAIKVAEESCGSCSLDIVTCECVEEELRKAYILMEYRLLESESSHGSIFGHYDIMGITFDKQKATDWVNNSPEFRTYKETKEIE